ncbi:hypothetical protein C0Q70_03852 [Pomacea canaliculata]|uniref:RING finger protein 207 n=1 Tax=Pomacea canaliculata TaxID=400727 RepID=A0A2T7PTW2_POMCA|nr:hypothetical protein C0Q70_03852 [Pomacea canaliculata]
MSGEIFHPMENSDQVDSKTWNPLQCPLCNEPYENPCILHCFHSFCERCLRGRALDSKMKCPVCGTTTHLKDGAVLPPRDLLLKFMVESSTDEKAPCANCDSFESSAMFFCNTCCQPLCSTCREETHRARMFATHDLVLMNKRTRDIHKRCSLHGEPYIMFSMEKKIMLCINCFRDMRIESRTHCVDLETAYNQSCKKLDHSVQAIRDLQHSVRDGIHLLRTLLDEIKENAEKEQKSLMDLYTAVVDKMQQTKDMLLEEVDSQYREKEKMFKAQLMTLSTLLPTLHVHLVMSGAFSSATNKFEFLDWLISLEPLLFHSAQHRMSRPCVTSSARLWAPAIPASNVSQSTLVPNMSPVTARRSNGLNGAKVKFIDAKGQFADHCVEFESAHRDLIQKLEKMKITCQEVQRDVTMRRCLARKDEIQRLQDHIEGLLQQLETHFITLDGKKLALEKHWEESLQRIANEQDLYQAQLNDVKRLKAESDRLRLITSQLTSFVSSITAVTERLSPKLSNSYHSSEQDNQMSALLEEINAVQPDSQQRVEAIRDAEEERQTKSASRTNPLDCELIKTKGMLKAPSVRDRRDSTSLKRDSSALVIEDSSTSVIANVVVTVSTNSSPGDVISEP